MSRMLQNRLDSCCSTILDLLDAARTSRLIQQNYIETLFNYQRNVFLLESAVGREITS